MSKPKSLSEAVKVFGVYPDDHPQTLKDLLDADPASITNEFAWFLRAQAVEVMRSSENHYVNGPKDAFGLLKNGYALHPWSGKWVSYALSSQRQLVKVAHERGGLVPLRKYTPIIPKWEDLPQLPFDGGAGVKKPAWLVIYGGTPEVLSKPGVARGLATLQRRASVSDVLFFDRVSVPTLWSVRAGVGIQDTGSSSGREIDFPDSDALEDARGGEDSE